MRSLLATGLLAFVLVAVDRPAACAAGADSTSVGAVADTLPGQATTPPAPPAPPTPPAPPAKRARLSAPT